MSTFQEMIQFFNNTHVRNAIHENVCVIFYGTDLILVDAQKSKQWRRVNKIEGKDKKHFSALLKIAKKGQLLIENTVS